MVVGGGILQMNIIKVGNSIGDSEYSRIIKFIRMKKLLLILFVLFLGLEAHAQHFSNLPEKERNEKLIELARKEFKKKDCYLDTEYRKLKTLLQQEQLS